MKKLINCLPGKTVRWIDGESDYAGLHVETALACQILVIVGKVGGRGEKNAISLTHYEGFGDIKDRLNRELEWMTQIDDLYTLYRPGVPPSLENTALNAIDELVHESIFPFKVTFGKKYYSSQLPQGQGAIKVEYMFNASTGRKEAGVQFFAGDALNAHHDMVNHPCAADIYVYYKINNIFAEFRGYLDTQALIYSGDITRADNPHCFFFNDKQFPLNFFMKKSANSLVREDVIFDGAHFSRLKLHDTGLSIFANRALQFAQLDDAQSFEAVFLKMVDLLEHLEHAHLDRYNPRHMIKELDNESQAIELTDYVLYILKKTALAQEAFQQSIKKYQPEANQPFTCPTAAYSADCK